MYAYRICILERILLLFTIYAYLSVTVVLKHSLCISCGSNSLVCICSHHLWDNANSKLQVINRHIYLQLLIAV